MIDTLPKDCRCPCCGVADNRIHFLSEAGYAVKYRQYECDACGFQFTFPEPLPEEIDAYYAREYYARGESLDPGMYQDYDKQSEGTLAFWQNWLPEFTAGRGLRLLDVGCALGRYMSIAESQFGYVCTGIELSDYAREYVTKTYGGRFPVYKTLDLLPVQNEPFDVILLFDVIEHVNSPWTLLWPLFQKGCVGARTRILITTPNVSSSKALADPSKWKYRYPPAHLSFCSPKTFAWISRMLLFRDCKVTGHSPYGAQVNDVKSFLARPYAEYDGLFCEFCGSTLSGLPEEVRALAWSRVLDSPEYAQLYVEWLRDPLPEPRNLAAEEMLDQSMQRLTAENASLSQDLSEVNNRLSAANNRLSEVNNRLSEVNNRLSAANNRLSEAEEKNTLLASDWNRIRQRNIQLVGHISSLNGMVTDLNAHIAERNNRIQEITGSHAYRIGRWITAPYRVLRRVRHAVRSRCGLGWPKCLVRRRVRRFSVIASIGVNCEVSFHINRIFGFVDSYPLVWAFVDTVGCLPKFLRNPSAAFESKNVVHDYSSNMCNYVDYGIHFHCQGTAASLLDDNGNVDPVKSRDALAEVSSRMRYLSGKWMDLVRDRHRSLLCVLRIWPQTTTEEVLAVWKTISCYPRVRLLVVLNRNEGSISVWRLKVHGIYVRYVDRRPPHNAVTELSMNDVAGWDRIFSEFQPIERKAKSKKLKYE